MLLIILFCSSRALAAWIPPYSINQDNWNHSQIQAYVDVWMSYLSKFPKDPNKFPCSCNFYYSVTWQRDIPYVDDSYGYPEIHYEGRVYFDNGFLQMNKNTGCNWVNSSNKLMTPFERLNEANQSYISYSTMKDPYFNPPNIVTRAVSSAFSYNCSLPDPPQTCPNVNVNHGISSNLGGVPIRIRSRYNVTCN